MGETRMRVDTVIREYMGDGDIAKENANMDKGPSGLLFAVGGEGLKKDNLRELRENGFGNLVDLHNKGAIHIHDLNLGLRVPYCYGGSLQNLLNNGITANIRSLPPKHLSSATNILCNAIGILSNEVAGAVAFNDVDTLLAPYAYKAYLDFKKQGCSKNIAFQLARRDLYQNIQSLIFHLNYSTRFANQAPFSNLNMSVTVPDDMKDQLALVGGKPLADYYEFSKDGIRPNNNTYGDLHEWVELVTEAFLDTMLDGDEDGRSFTFPVTTFSVTEGFFEHRLLDKICDLTAKYGSPFFQNFINGHSGGERIDPSDTRALCCRLSLSQKDIAKHIGGIFGNGDNTGSLQVVTLNLSHIAHADRDKFFENLGDIMDEVADEMLFKREIVEREFKNGFYNVLKQNNPHGFDSFFTTFGYIDLFGAVQVLNDDADGFLNDEGMELAQEILNFMVARAKKYHEETGCLMNVEGPPNEGSSLKMAKKTLKHYPDYPHRGTKSAPYLTNSHHPPVEYQDQLDMVYKTQSKLATIPNGGTTMNFTTNEDLSREDVKNFIWTTCQTKIPYFSLNVIHSVCPIHGVVKPDNKGNCPYYHSPEDIEWLEKNQPDLLR